MIPQYQKILYATDLSVNAAHAFRHAIGIARRDNARIWILHVLPEMESSVLNYVSTVMGEARLAELETSHKEEVVVQIRARLQDFAHKELADNQKDLTLIKAIEVHHGPPVSVILEAADRIEADLIVVGSHGKGKLKYAFLGSVAEKVLRKALVPVLVVPLRP